MIMPIVSIPTVAVAGLVLLSLYKFIFYPAFFSPLAKIPAATWHARFTPLWSYYIKFCADNENKTVLDLHERYGPIFLMGPNELSVNCYEGGLKTIYAGGFPKTEFYRQRFANYGITNMFTILSNKDHSQRKRMLSNIYSKSLVLSSPLIRSSTQTVLLGRLLPVFQKSSETLTPVEVHKLNYAYGLDTFTPYQFGPSLGTNFIQDVEKRQWYLSHFFGPRPYLFSWQTEFPKLTESLLKLGIRLIPKSCEDSAHQIEAWLLDLCDQAASQDSIVKTSEPTVFTTFLNKFRDADTKAGHDVHGTEMYPHRLELASEMLDHKAASHEPSANTLTWLYYEMSLRPEVQDQLRGELEALDPPIKFPLLHRNTNQEGDLLPDFKTLDSLPLLDAIVQETLRLWPTVTGGQRRLTPPGGPSSLAGYDGIPPGVEVHCSAYSLHRNPDVFPDPESWDPRRWMDAKPDQLAEMRRWFWAFGSGGRMCIGSHFAVNSMKLAIASVYTNYTTTIVDAEGIEQGEGFLAGPKGNKLWLQFTHV